MANDENQREEAPKAERELYHLHNVTRGRHNRTLRASQPKHHGLKQYLAGGKYRSIRGRPIVLTREQVGEHIEEIARKTEAGIFELRTPDGRIVDLRTGDAAGRGAVPPLPRRIPDSIANDKQNVGQAMPQYVGGDVEGAPGVEPALIKDSEIDDPPPPPPPPVPPPVPSAPPVESKPEIIPPPQESSRETSLGEDPEENPEADASDELPDLLGDDEDEGSEASEASDQNPEAAPARKRGKKKKEKS